MYFKKKIYKYYSHRIEDQKKNLQWSEVACQKSHVRLMKPSMVSQFQVRTVAYEGIRTLTTEQLKQLKYAY